MATVQKEAEESVGVTEEVEDAFFGFNAFEPVTVDEVAGVDKDTLDPSDFSADSYVRVTNPFNFVQLYREG